MIASQHSDQPQLHVADNISAMIAYWDKNLICRYANASYLTWFGKKSEDMIDKMTIMELLGPLYEQNLIYIHAALNGEPQTFEREIPLPSGEKRYTLANYFPHFEHNEVKGFFVHVADVHNLKKLQQDLALSNQIVLDQNKRLQNFANIVSHNLKSYSANLASLLYLFTEEESEQDKAVVIRYLRDLSNNFTSTVAHLTEIVTFQNLTDKRYTSCNLFNYVEKTIAMLRLEIEKNEAKVYNQISPELMLITNEAYLDSIILNLLTNAIKYRHPDRKPVISLNAANENSQTMLEISDNGLGIDLEQYGNSLFGMNNTFHGNSDARGIGLYITKFQVDSLGGFIEVQSEVNIGTTFRVAFLADHIKLEN